MPRYLECDVAHGLHPVHGSAVLSGEHVRLVVGLHAEGRHVVLGAGLRHRRQDGDALRQPDDLLVQPPGFLIGPAPAAPARARPPRRGRVEELEAGDAILAGGVQDEPVLLPFLKQRKVEG